MAKDRLRRSPPCGRGARKARENKAVYDPLFPTKDVRGESALISTLQRQVARVHTYIACLITVFASKTSGTEIFNGEPFGEALYDVVLSGAVAVSHQDVKATPLIRVDAFKLSDGQLLILHAQSSRIGEPYSLKAIFVSHYFNDSDLKEVPHFALPARAKVAP